MNELIVIQPKQIGNEEINSVDARDLHSHLGIKKPFTDWIKYTINKLGLIENVDYLYHKIVNHNDREVSVYILTFDWGKHIAMMTNTSTAHEIRTYFIEYEKRTRLLTAPPLTPQMQLSQAVLLAQSIIAEKDIQIEQRDKLIAIAAPKAAALDQISMADGEMNISNAAKTLGFQKIKDCFQWLFELKWIFKRGGNWIAHQDKLRTGLLTSKVTKYESSDGTEKISEQTLVTAKGLTKLAELQYQKTSLLEASPCS